MSKKSSARLFNRYLESWDHHHAMNNFSLPQREGIKAIIYGTRLGSVDDPDTKENNRLLESFEQEAYEIADECRQLGGRALLYTGMSLGTFSDVLEDRRVSDIVVIGNGSFSAIYSDSWTTEQPDYIEWTSVARRATHLKQGAFIQRTCGHFLSENRLSPPFGMFALSDHRNIFSPINEYFGPENTPNQAAVEAEEQKIRQVSSVGRISLAYANTHFRQEHAPNCD